MEGDNKEKDKSNSRQVTKNLCSLLKSQPLIEMQIKFEIFCAHVRLPFTRYYAKLPALEPEVTQSSEWDWRGLPDEWPLARLWTTCSSAWMCVVVLKTLFSEQLFALAHLLTGWPGHCVIMGRFVLHPSLAALAAFLFASFHLSWRYMQQLKTRVYMLGIFSFLLQTERDLDHFLELLQADAGAARPEGSEEVDRKLPDNHELFFRHIMCYKVHLESGRVVYKLRPNRTWQSRATMVDSFVLTSFAVTCAFLTLAIPGSSIVALACLSDLRFVQLYPGCQPHLDHLYTSGQLTSFWSWTFSGYRLISLLFDLVENFLIWIDSGVALTFVLTLTYLMNYDILLYWHHLDQRIRAVLLRVRAHHQSIDSDTCARRSVAYLSLAHSRPPTAGSGEWREWAQQEQDRQQLEAELNELHFEIIDFFEQVKEADKIVGDILTMAILIWLICIAAINYYYLVRVQSNLPPITRWIQLLGLVVITLATHYILKLHRCCSRSYESLCSLIAFDRSTSARKRKLIALMDYFTKRQATTYTLFRRIPYLTTTYLTIIGWSFSLVVVSYGLFDRESPLSRWKTAATTTTTAPSNVLILGGPKYFAFSSSLL